jgi:hypothetical protein
MIKTIEISYDSGGVAVNDREKLNHLMQWKDGNGALGAEERLRRAEDRLQGCVDKDDMVETNKRIKYLTVAVVFLAATGAPEGLQQILTWIGRIF